jgi:hypothetical protein
MRRVVLVLASCVLAAPSLAQAQISALGAAGSSTQAAGASDIPYLGPPFGGTSAALLGGADLAIARNVSVGGEASLATAISGDQSQRTSTSTNAFTSRHRDSVFSGVLKIGTPIAARLHAAFALGGGGAYRRTTREGTTASIFPPAARSPFTDIVSNVVFAYSLGGDVDVRIARRIRILILARWHRLRDDDLLPDGVVRRGISSTVFRTGIGAKMTF